MQCGGYLEWERQGGGQKGLGNVIRCEYFLDIVSRQKLYYVYYVLFKKNRGSIYFHQKFLEKNEKM